MDIARLFDVRGKTALVTGASGGIGYMIAEGLVAAGCKVFICSRKAADIAAAAERLAANGGEVIAMPADLSTAEGIAAVAEAVNAAGPLHILVNNAGATFGAPLERFPREGFEKVLRLNLLAPFELTKALLPALEAAATREDPARVINIGSIDGLTVPRLGNYSYSASKAAVHHLTRHLAAELAPSILVNAIAPGPFPSKMMAATLDAVGDQIAAATPVKRIGRTEDVAAAAVYLASRATNFMTGAVIPLDGGLSTTVGVGV